jgi:hypothetical protein
MNILNKKQTPMQILKEFIFKKGAGIFLVAVMLDSYRRQVLSDRIQVQLDEVRVKYETLAEKEKSRILTEVEYYKNKETMNATVDTLKQDIDDYSSVAKQGGNQSDLDRTSEKVNESIAVVKKLDLSDYLNDLYTKYIEFLANLSPDKIVCIFNIILDGVILSSFLSVLSILLSEKIINQITILKDYPKILNFLKLKNNISKKISKIYLLMHLLTILFGLLANVYMFLV